MASARPYFCYLCLVIIATTSSNSTNPSLDDIFQALEQLIIYLKNNIHSIHFDVVYGIRVVEGQAFMILQKYQSGVLDLQLSHLRRLQGLHELAKSTGEAALKYIAEDDPDYYHSLHPIIDIPMLISKPYRKLDPLNVWSKLSHSESFNESVSDACMQDLMGLHNTSKCHISEECRTVMTKNGMREYSLQHQLLFTALADNIGCHDVLELVIHPRKVSDLQAELCANSLIEMHGIVHDSGDNILPAYQDLFLEQEFVCSMFGFMEFLHFDWLKQILSWQKPSGCWGKMKKPHVLHLGVPDYEYEISDEDDNINYGKKPAFDDAIHVKPREYVNGQDYAMRAKDLPLGGMRRLFSEKELEDGCLLHKSAVAACALSQYLRFALDPGSAEYQQYAHMDGVNWVKQGLDAGDYVPDKGGRGMLQNIEDEGEYDINDEEGDLIKADEEKSEGDYDDIYRNDEEPVNLNIPDKDMNQFINKPGNDKQDEEELENHQLYYADEEDIKKDYDKDYDDEKEGDFREADEYENRINPKFQGFVEKEEYLKNDDGFVPHDMNQNPVPGLRPIKGELESELDIADAYAFQPILPTDSNTLNPNTLAHHKTINNSESYIYSVVVFLMLLGMYFLYRLVKKRRVLIRYHYSR